MSDRKSRAALNTGNTHLYYLGDVRNGNVSHRDAVEDRPEFNGLLVDGHQAGPRGARCGCLCEDGVARRPAIEAQVAPSDHAVIVYTSGSTSLPKAVQHTQWNISRHPPELAKLFLIQPEDRMLPMLPAFWLGGMAMAMQVRQLQSLEVLVLRSNTRNVLARKES